MNKTRYIFEKFSPAEVARVTGISQDLQRDWRRRGLLEKKTQGWEQFDLDDLVKLSVAGLLIDRGLPASVALNAAVAPNIQFLTIIAERSTEFDPRLPEHEQNNWATKIPEFTKRRFRRFYVWAKPIHPYDLFVGVTDNVNELFDKWRQEGKDAGAAVVVDLEWLADQIIERTGRPLMRVELVDDD